MSAATIIAPTESTTTNAPAKGTTGGAALFRALVSARANLASTARRGGDVTAASTAYQSARDAFLAHEPDARETLTLTVPPSKLQPEHRRTLPVRDAQSLIEGNVPTTLAVLFRSKVA